MGGLYFGIASLIFGLAIIIYIIRVIRKEGKSQPYFASVSMGIVLIVLGVALIIPYI